MGLVAHLSALCGMQSFQENYHPLSMPSPSFKLPTVLQHVLPTVSQQVTVSLVTQEKMNDISDSLSLEKCFSEALPLPRVTA